MCTCTVKFYTFQSVFSHSQKRSYVSRKMVGCSSVHYFPSSTSSSQLFVLLVYWLESWILIIFPMNFSLLILWNVWFHICLAWFSAWFSSSMTRFVAAAVIVFWVLRNVLCTIPAIQKTNWYGKMGRYCICRYRIKTSCFHLIFLDHWVREESGWDGRDWSVMIEYIWYTYNLHFCACYECILIQF